ncbi:MAG: LacI family DNA-binding transcriptional regulator [Anaerolineae bacterium]|nr:LacI family DNA-binding transcriptional regulator [Anaerolineae bacterium]
MPVTIKDIARKAGVSHATVSRALNGSPLISQETTLAIRKLAEEMGYLPSAAARGLKTSRSHVLGVIVSRIGNPYFGEIVQGIEDALKGTAYSIFVASSHLDAAVEENIVRAFGEHRVDGVIVATASFSRSQVHLLRRYGIPIVAINSSSPQDYRFCIAHDDVYGARQVARHLIALGHRRIAYIGNMRAAQINHDRIVGFKQEMESAGIALDANLMINLQWSEIENGVEGMTTLMRRKDRPTAVFCFNDLIAIGALQVAQRMGIRVPQEISITGFDNITYSAYTLPALTTFDQPKRLIGAEAAGMLLDLINRRGSGGDDERAAPAARLLRGKLLVRESTARCMS